MTDTPPTLASKHPNGGLCDRCKHMRLIESSNGSQFLRCERGLTDPEFPKYPRLPVWSCRGFEERGRKN
jgi:hypothetical protein